MFKILEDVTIYDDEGKVAEYGTTLVNTDNILFAREVTLEVNEGEEEIHTRIRFVDGTEIDNYASIDETIKILSGSKI